MATLPETKLDKSTAMNKDDTPPHEKTARDLLFKSSLAYCYGYSPAAFWRLVHRNTACLASLFAAGYSKRARILSPAQLRVVCQFFGYPLTLNEIEDND